MREDNVSEQTECVKKMKECFEEATGTGRRAITKEESRHAK